MQANCSGLSLRVRVGKIVAIFSILLVSFYTTMLAMLYELGLSDATHGIVWQEAALYKKAYALNKKAPLPNTQSLKGFIGEETLPQYILDRFPKEDWETSEKYNDGMMYRYQKNENSESHYHLLINNLPDTDKKLFIYYDITVSDRIASKIWYKFKILAIVGGLLVVLMLLIFRKIIHRALEPIGNLSDWINELDESHLPQALPGNLRNDEIGQLAARLYNALTRIHHHNERERQFLRNASHELRTPIAIIRNAMDVIEHKKALGKTDIDPLLQRIRRAGDTMKSVTEAILWLAIEGYSSPVKGDANLKAMLEEIIEENKSLLNGKNVQLKIDIDNLGIQESESTLVHIALDNIVRNAFQHCSQGDITISAVAPNGIAITNSYCCYSSCTQEKSQSIDDTLKTGGFGLGLALVQKIAERQQWQFSFEVHEDTATALFKLP